MTSYDSYISKLRFCFDKEKNYKVVVNIQETSIEIRFADKRMNYGTEKKFLCLFGSLVPSIRADVFSNLLCLIQLNENGFDFHFMKEDGYIEKNKIRVKYIHQDGNSF